MKKAIFLYIPAMLAVLFSAAFGIAKRGSYTNITAKPDYMDQLQVGQIPDQLAERSCKEMEKVLPDCPVILRVKAAEKVEYIFGSMRQKVRIEKVYKGEGLEAGQEICLCARGWGLSLGGGLDSIECNFVNVMDMDTDYLIFASHQVDSLGDDVPLYQLYDEQIIMPVFCYDERINKIMPMDGEGTYVPYKDVKNNEFFAASEYGVSTWGRLKSKMLELYP